MNRIEKIDKLKWLFSYCHLSPLSYQDRRTMKNIVYLLQTKYPEEFKFEYVFTLNTIGVFSKELMEDINVVKEMML